MTHPRDEARAEKPTPAVEAGPVAWMAPSGEVIDAAKKATWAAAGKPWDAAQADYTIPLFAHPPYLAVAPVGETPITMQDIRLHAGEGKLSAQSVLDAANAELRLRASTPGGGELPEGCPETAVWNPYLKEVFSPPRKGSNEVELELWPVGTRARLRASGETGAAPASKYDEAVAALPPGGEAGKEGEG